MRVRIDLAYDGSNFSGWARQPDLRTVQGELERCLRTVLRVSPNDPAEPLKLTVAGRTDAGVHASNQVCHVDMAPQTLAACIGHLEMSGVDALQHRLRHLVPDDIAIHGISVAPAGFDARFSALERTYVYRICDNPSKTDPRLRSCVLSLDDRLDMGLMGQTADLMVGLHDFGSFATPNPGGTTIREVKSAFWSHESGPATACFTVTADAFAHNMVRSLVHASVEVGRHRRTVSWFADKLEHPRREGDTGPIAACGLTLEAVVYPPEGELAERATKIRAKRTLGPGAEGIGHDA